MGQSESSTPTSSSTPSPRTSARGAKRAEERLTDSDLADSFDFEIAALVTDEASVEPQDKPPVRAYLNRNTDESFNSSLGSQIEFRLSAEDLKAPWFWRDGTRGLAHEALAGAPSGSFLIRPSSHRGMYALSWRKGGQVRDNIVYCCWPGYALKREPRDSERFASLGSLVAHCPFLRAPCPLPAGGEARAAALVRRQLRGCLAQLPALAGGAGEPPPNGVSLEWSVCLLEALDTYLTPEQCERRTSIRCGRREWMFPALLPLTPEPAAALALLLRPPCWVQRLVLSGFEGMGRHNFCAVLDDATFGIRDNETVTELDVSTNLLTDAGAAALGRLLRSSRALRRVSVARNFVTAAGLALLGEGLSGAGALDELVLAPQMEPGSSPPRVSQDAAADRVAGALGNALRRRHELVRPTEKGCYRLRGVLPDDAAAAALLLAVRPTVPGLYVLYLSPCRPDSVQLAFTANTGTAGIAVHHRTIYRHPGGYSLEPVVASLARHAAWRAWAAGLAGRPLPQALAQELAWCEELFFLWCPESVPLDMPADLAGPSLMRNADPWRGEYPTLFFLTSALRGWLKIGLTRRAISTEQKTK